VAVLRFVDDAHAAFTELAGDGVVRQFFAGHSLRVYQEGSNVRPA
jgi:hypothetical protein